MALREPFDLFRLLRTILLQDRAYFWAVIVYGIAISMLTLAVPISVQVLIEAVANTALVQPIVVLSVILMGVLVLSGVLVALQVFVLELFERRVFGRLSAEITMRTLYAETTGFESEDRLDLLNRFFEIEAIHISVPVLLSGGLTLVLQTLVGYVVVSFYHPFFLVISVAHALLVVAIWASTNRGAIATKLKLSTAKYEMANWLENLALNHRLFKSDRAISVAADRSDALTATYVKAHKAHFRYTYAQTLSLLLLYALANAALLGVGGWLVVRGELTLGQLVAAELILGAIFAGMARFYYYLEQYYTLCAAMQKLDDIYSLELESPDGDRQIVAWQPDVRLKGAHVEVRGRDYQLDVDFPAGTTSLVATEAAVIAQTLVDLLQRHRVCFRGQVLLGGHEIQHFRVQQLRSGVAVVCDQQLFECTIADFLSVGNDQLSRADMRALLEVVGLDTVVDNLEDGVDTWVKSEGQPLTLSETIRLKIAQALAAQPKLLVFTSVCDTLRPYRLDRILQYIRSLRGTTFIYLSNRLELEGFDQYVALSSRGTVTFGSLRELDDYVRSVLAPRAPRPAPPAPAAT